MNHPAHLSDPHRDSGLRVAVLGLDVIGEGLGLLVAVVVVAVVVVRGTDVVHLVDAAALGAALDGAVLGDLGTQN